MEQGTNEMGEKRTSYTFPHPRTMKPNIRKLGYGNSPSKRTSKSLVLIPARGERKRPEEATTTSIEAVLQRPSTAARTEHAATKPQPV